MLRDALVSVGVIVPHTDVSIAKLYPHSIGHWLGTSFSFIPRFLMYVLGMDTHDTEGIKDHTNFQPGMIVTIEPGVHLPLIFSCFSLIYKSYIGPHPKIPKHFHNIGIRIEDNVLITSNSPEVLTINTPKEIFEIEAVMRHGQ